MCLLSLCLLDLLSKVPTFSAHTWLHSLATSSSHHYLKLRHVSLAPGPTMATQLWAGPEHESNSCQNTSVSTTCKTPIWEQNVTTRHELFHLTKEVGALSTTQEDKKKPHTPELIEKGGENTGRMQNFPTNPLATAATDKPQISTSLLWIFKAVFKTSFPCDFSLQGELGWDSSYCISRINWVTCTLHLFFSTKCIFA